MGSIRTIRRSLLEEVVDTVSIKSGLLLTQSKAISLLNKQIGENGWWANDLDSILRIRFEEVENTFLELMVAVGTLPDVLPPNLYAADYVKNNAQTLGFSPTDINMIMEVSTIIFAGIQEVKNGENTSLLDPYIRALPDFQEFIAAYISRDIQDCNPIEMEWTDAIPLNALFESEKIQGCTKGETFFDQRYIEYLRRQTADLHDIHWRQFEYLTGEYFARAGYSVKIGPGRKDGGKDIILRKTDDECGPTLILVQCRRYSEKNPVDLDSVRAFWSTVNDDNASKGIIATTSRLTKDADSYCRARLYRLTAYEQEKVTGWLDKMRVIQ